MDYQNRLRYINSFIPKTNLKKFPGEYGLKRVKLMLEKVGNPQEKVKVIHIAGTSGKGSTSTILAALLQAHGFRVGLHVKPHLYDMRERFQINNMLITEDEFVTYADTFFGFMDEVNAAGYGQMTYYEVVISFAYYVFFQKQVDYAVVETGLGGTYDGSNVVSNPAKVSVLTSIGFDHMEVLGNTIEEIASQKAGIIQKGNVVFSLYQSEVINAVIENCTKNVKAQLYFVKEGKDFSKEPFSFTHNKGKLQDLRLNLLGDFQRINAAMALKTLWYLAERDSFSLSEEKIRDVFASISIPGRFDRITYKGKTIILDGAHNVQKMEAFLEGLQSEYGQRKFHFLVSFKEGKEIREMVKRIVPVAQSITLTNFFDDTIDFISRSIDPSQLADIVRSEGLQDVTVVDNSEQNMEKIIEETKDILVITGSFYLLSDIYKLLRRIQAGKV